MTEFQNLIVCQIYIYFFMVQGSFKHLLRILVIFQGLTFFYLSQFSTVTETLPRVSDATPILGTTILRPILSFYSDF